MADSEPFPPLTSAADMLLHSANGNAKNTTGADISSANKPRRRKSSALGGVNIRAGDTGAPAFASSRASLNATSPHADGRKRLSKRRRARGFLSRLRQTMLKHTFVLPAVLILLFLAAYAVNPNETNIVHRFIFLSYKLPPDLENPDAPIKYGKGLWDLAFVSFYTIVLSFTREFIMQEILLPIARRWCRSKGKQARFMEQMYTAIYFGVLGPAGLYVMSKTPVWYFNTRGMYENFPHLSHEAPVKFYYLFEAAYWAQQAIVLVLGMEKPRKDFKELVGHHIVTLSLIALSYRFHFVYIGLAVYTTHDLSDFFLATSKVLNYIDHPLLDPFFVIFVGVWIYLRHYINLVIIWSLLTEFETIGPFEMDWEGEQFKCRLSQVITTTLLSALQALNLFWLYCILRIAYRFVFMKELADDRSDDEEEVETEESEEGKPLANGEANGASNGHTNGHTNGKANGQTNGHANGHTNGHTNGKAIQSEN